MRRAGERDAAEIAGIYNFYVAHSTATFETEPVDIATIAERVQDKLGRHDYLVGDVDGRIVAFAYYGPFRGRAAYSHTVESSVYVRDDAIAKGYGRTMYDALLDSAVQGGFREVVAFIALPNDASVALHESSGFAEVGMLRRVGLKFGRYVDVAIYQRTIANNS